MRKTTIAAVALLAGLGSCQGQQAELDTRTFEVDHLEAEQAAEAVEPYVFTDRKEAPGKMSVFSGGVTVRETEDNLAKIQRVLERIDRSKPGVRFHLQIVGADGAGNDPRIEHLESLLENFRYEGYRLLDEVQILTTEGELFRQQVSLNGRAGRIMGEAEELRVTDDGGTVRVGVSLEGSAYGDPETGILSTTVTVRLGQTAVLGISRSEPDEGAIILTMRAELARTNTGSGTS